jgi:C-terminal processing protease CtpA/Prc
MKSTLVAAFCTFVFSGALTGSSPDLAQSPGLQQSTKSESQPAGWLGISVGDIGKEKAEELKLKSTDGAYVASVVDDSPADSIGLKEGDVITNFGGRQIYDAEDLSKAVKRTGPGTKVAVDIIRKGEKKTLNVVLGPAPRHERTFTVRTPRAHAFRFATGFGTQGMKLLELNEQLAQYFQVPEGEGVLVVEVKKASAAAKAGLQAGDVLMRMGGKRIDEVSDVVRAFDKLDVGEKTNVELLRKGSKKTLTITLEEQDSEWDLFVPHGSVGMDVFAPEGPDLLEYRFDVAEPEIEGLNLKLEQLDKSLELQQDHLQKKLETIVRVRELRTI